MFNGTNMGLGTLAKLSNAKSRSLSAENVYGEKGKGGMAVLGKVQASVKKIGQHPSNQQAASDLGQGWKARPCIQIPAGTTAVIADIKGPGVIQHQWYTFHQDCSQDLILRMYWDGKKKPAVEAPIADFFGNNWGEPVNINAVPINVNPLGGCNCYFPMPFRKKAKITVENTSKKDVRGFFYTINYILTRVDKDEAYFHAAYNKTEMVKYGEDYVILDKIKGKGHYVGVSMGWQQSKNGWWGEGEIKMFLDGDKKFPTIIGTGTEDYFGGAWCFTETFSAPFLGYPYGYSGRKQKGPGKAKKGDKHLLYRFHVLDPVRFSRDLKVTMQALGWGKDGKYLPMEEKISSVCYWYQKQG